MHAVCVSERRGLTTGLVQAAKGGIPVGSCPLNGWSAHSYDASDPSDTDWVCRLDDSKKKLAVLLHASPHVVASACMLTSAHLILRLRSASEDLDPLLWSGFFGLPRELTVRF